MKPFYLRSFLFLVAMSVVSYRSTGANKIEDKPVVSQTFPSTQTEGVIGTSEESPIDNPADNIFHVAVTTRLQSSDKVWLVYDLDGVQDHTGVSRSVNDQMAVGGYLVKRRNGWATQRERVNPSWLKEGDNIIRFTTPENSMHGYRIKNLRFEIENVEGGREEKVVLNQPTLNYFFDKAYIKGFIASNEKNVQVKIAGKEARVFNGEFESIIDFTEAQVSCLVEAEIIYADGTTLCQTIKFAEPHREDYHYSLDHYTYRSTKFFQASANESLSLHGASLTCPASSLEEMSMFSITSLRAIDIPALDAGMVNVTRMHAGFRFLPNGTKFKNEVEIIVPFDASLVPDGYTEKDIRTYYFDEESHHWIPVKRDTVYNESSEVVSKTVHFTDYINAIIKVPESPEAEAYNSTSIKGIKAANPTAGINLINPPQANNTGSASISYPINIPPGRNGMQPQLAISYNSGGGNSWLGLGWNLAIPAITIDTRWGVPLYDPAKETETYSFNGEQLSPVAHRGELKNRYASGMQFYPRVEGAFNKIIRHGDKPWNYYWEVTDKNGTKYFYGAEGTDTSPDPDAILTDNENNTSGKQKNIAYWALRETRDANGNTVKYHYAKVPDTGVANGTVNGWQIYVSRITYTGHNGSDGPFEVIFTRSTSRTDKIIAGNLGFKQVTGSLLTRIDVKYNNGNPVKPVRHYELTYVPGQFQKTLLSRITEFDAAGQEFNHHEFKYYNDVVTNGAPLKGNINWNVPSDNIEGDFKTDAVGFRDEATALGGTKSKDLNVGLNVSVGVGVNVFTKKLSGGVSGGYSKSESDGLLTMMDMNGDGLQDKVFIKDGFYYRPNLLAITGREEFGERKTISGVNGFFAEKSKTTTFGGEVSFGAFVGYSNSRTTSKTTTYVTDVNGDQLPDIVRNGKVYFNHLDTQTGNINYTLESAGTPNVIYSSLNISDDLVDKDALERERLEAIEQNPLLDVVRLWRAPYDGDIKITAPVRLLESIDPLKNETPRDGVRLSVQLKDTQLWSQDVGANDYGQYLTQPLNNLSVKAGDMVFFRVGSKDNGLYDSVEWKPAIEYLNKPDKKDANRKHLYKFSSEEDYLISSEQWVAAPVNGRIKITGQLIKPRTTDNVTLLILKGSGDEETIADTVWRRKYKWNDEVTSFPDTTINVINNERYLFKVITGTNIDWTAFKWRPHMVYESTESGGIDLTKSPIEVYPVAHHSLFVNTLRLTPEFKVELDSAGQRDTLDFKPILNFTPDPFGFYNHLNGQVTFSVKKTDTLLAVVKLPIVNGFIADDTTLSVPVRHGDTLFVEYHFSDHRLALALTAAKAETVIKESTKTMDAGIFTVIPHNRNDKKDKQEDVIYGTLYRGWGHFGWNGNNGWEQQAIDRSQLRINEKAAEQKEIDTEGMEGDELETSGSNYDAKKDRFFPLVASGGDQKWASGDQYAYLLSNIMSSSRLGDDDLSVIQIAQGGLEGNTSATAIDKVSKSKGKAWTYGGSLGFSVAKSQSSADSYSMTDYMDMNGDRYPDVVTEKIIQYTNALGGLSDKVIQSKGEVQKTHATTDGYTVSGSFPMTMPKFRKGPKKSENKTEGGDAASTSGSASLSVGKTTGDNNSEYTWLDINGDGLPDRVDLSGGKVALNIGYGFETAEPWGFGQIQQGGSETTTGGGGLGFNFGQNSISAGFSLARSDNFANEVFADINGDGLVDKIKKGNPLQVSINTGNGFAAPIAWNGASSISESATASESANAAFTVGFSWLGVKWTVTPSVSGGNAMSRELLKIIDMDGDGFPDVVRSNADNNLTMTPSTIARTNLLKEVKRPLGASFTMDYTQIGNTYEMPNNVWALTKVKVMDGFAGDGPDTLLTTFSYEGGYHDRRERDFFGFSKVITNTHDTEKEDRPVYTTVTQTFNNSNYYEKGLLVSELMTDAGGKKFVEKNNKYVLKDIETGAKLPESVKTDPQAKAFPALTVATENFYEGQENPGKTTSTTFGYDVLGNVTHYVDLGDHDSPDDDLTATITYHDLQGKYIVSTPKSIVVTGQGITYRKRESVIDPNTGDIKQIKQFLSENEVAQHDLEYDGFGNLKKITRPPNSKGERLSFEYEYDTEVSSYVTKVKNSYGYSSEARHSVLFGQRLNSKDINGNEITYEIDARGRIVNIQGPYEKGGANRTIVFEYYHDATIPWALTKHFDPSDPKNTLNTVTFVDGLGRALQTKKDVALYAGEGKADTEMMAVSGRAHFDAFGRTVRAHYPTTASAALAELGNFVSLPDEITPTTTSYDVLNRTLSVVLPDGAETKTEYGFGADRDGKNQFSTKTIDANGKQTEQFTDARGRVTSVKNVTTEKMIWTSFKYNAINEQIEARDDLGHATVSTYDNFGRRVGRVHPDAGETKYTYDLAGNLTQLETANLLKEGLAIQYSYNFERLAEIMYPQNPENNVKYTYGEMGATDNRAGKIVLQEDASGAQEFFYGPLGEVVKNIRTVIIPQHDEQTYVTEWKYDTWNRLTSMTYADGEVVTYTYNAGGLLRSMDGKKKSSTFSYVKQLGYDKFEQRVFLAYGNGTKTTYNYEPDRRRLEKMTAQTSAKRLFMDNVYTYDKVNNILSLENKAPVPASNLMGGSSMYTYNYDDLYRLTSASGSYKGANEEHTYSLSTSYNSVGGIISKNQVHKKKDQEQKKTTYNLSYAYGDTQPHAPIHIGEQTYEYDANGNQTGWTSDVSGQRRVVLWDEENRIRSIYDNGSQHHYIYDASGERVIKGKTTGQRIFVNGEWKAGSGEMGNYTVYVNPYIVLTSGGYTKHYYIEAHRIVSKLGGGWDNNGQGSLKAGNGKVDYVGRGQKVFDGIVKNLKFLGADGQILTAGKSGKVPPGQVNGTGNVAEAFRYFYHPDHLGSTSYVTDVSGEVFQHLEYMAFGETFVEEHSNTDRTPYLFNGKELDEETGLYYYGARYFDPRTSVWQSVDALAEDFPSISPYAYTMNNPIIYRDPDGNDVVIGFTGGFEGGGETVDPCSEAAGTTGRVIEAARAYAEKNGIEFSGRVITSGATARSSVKNALAFIKENYTEGERVVIYGYSYGGDFAVELAEALKKEGITVDLLVTVDASDGPMQNSTVNTEIPDNVRENVNYYQLDDSGGSSSSQKSSDDPPQSGSSDSPGSNGGRNSPKNPLSTIVTNKNKGGRANPGVNHGTIDEFVFKEVVQDIEGAMKRKQE